MKAILYGIGLQFKLDIRSKTLLVTCYDQLVSSRHTK